MKEKIRILIVEDDLLSRLNLKCSLEKIGHVIESENSLEALSVLNAGFFDLAFVDLDLEEKLAGFKVLKVLWEKGIHSVVLSGRESDEVVEEAYLLGCSDFLSKPFTRASICSVIQKYQHSKIDLSKQLQNILITEDESLKGQIKIIEQAIFGEHPILITGESGTGKTFLAKYIHELVGKDKPFIHLNCAEISESLIESELFGHEKGAFTGAVKNKKGLMELADGGILFLDEIATLPSGLQKKLLKAIEEKTFYPVGSEKSVAVNFRLISATCEDLRVLVESGGMRKDFLFRLEGFNVYLKSLRERKQDLDSLINHFLRKNKRRIILSQEARTLLLEHSWPGNIRELEKTIEILRSQEKGIIEGADVQCLLKNTQSGFHKSLRKPLDLASVKEMGLAAYLEIVESQILEQVLFENKDKVRKTLSDLKLSNNSFYRIMTNIKAKASGDYDVV